MLTGAALFLLPSQMQGQYSRDFGSHWGGAQADEHYAVVLDDAGNSYYLGSSTSSNFPTTSGAYQTNYSGSSEHVITAVNGSGAVLWSTYLGGSNDDYKVCGLDISADNQSLYFGGVSKSDNYPGVGITSYQNSRGGSEDVVVGKMGINGNLVWATYLGGSAVDEVGRVNVGSSGDIYVAGSTYSSDFPVVAAIQGSKSGSQDGFITKFSATGSVLWSTYVGGNAEDKVYEVVPDNSGFIYVVGGTKSTNFPTANAAQSSNGGGWDFFVQKRNASTGAVVWSTYYGGSGADANNEIPGIAVSDDGSVYITGKVNSSNFPTSNAFQPSYGGGGDAGVVKFNNDGTVAWSTYLGNSSHDAAVAIEEVNGMVYIHGETSSASFPGIVSSTAFQSSKAGSKDMFVTVFREDGTVAYGSFYGYGSGDNSHDISVKNGKMSFGGNTYSGYNVSNAAQSNNAGGTDALITRFSARTFSTQNLSATPATDCNTSNGSITVTLNSSQRGTGNYDISLDGGFSYPHTNKSRSGNNIVLNNIASGTYTVVVRDATGQTANAGTVKVEGCVIDICNYEDADVFSVPAVNGATNYNWTVPTGAVIIAGQGTNTVLIDWQNAAIGTGEVCVTPSNANCTGEPTCLDVDVQNCVEICDNGIDDDNDGDVDCDDEDCSPSFVNVTPTDPSDCGTNNGQIVINASGASGKTIQYRLNTGSWQNSNTFTGLAAGSYNITIRYQGGTAACNVSYIANPVLLSAPSSPVISNITTSDPTNCGVTNGSITVDASVTGGANLQYRLNSGSWQNSNVFNNLSGGSYDVRVRVQGQTGCQFGPTTVILNTPSTPTIAGVTADDPTNCGVNNGTITISANGTGALEYSINNGANGSWSSSNIFSGLAAGTYNIKVRYAGASACEATYSSNPVTLSSPANPWIVGNPAGTDPTDCGVSDGTITVTANGGNAPYEYSKDDGSTWQSSNIFVNLGGGTYQIRVRSAVGTSCISGRKDVTLTAPTPINISNVASSNPAGCGTNNGSITITASGSGSREYSIDGGGSWQSSNSFSNLAAGTYNVRVRYSASETCETNYGTNRTKHHKCRIYRPNRLRCE